LQLNSKYLKIGSLAFFTILSCVHPVSLSAKEPDNPAVVEGIDASVKARIDNVAGYTVTEHYAVFRSHDETHPAAEMVVKTVYRKGVGKNYTILSQNGSSILRSEVLGTLLENEKRMSQPGNAETALIDSANYDMKLTSEPLQQLDGRNCLAVSLSPRRVSPFLFKGTLWVDARDYAIVQFEGTASRSSSLLTGAAKVLRQYAIVNGFPMATHAKAVSDSALLGQTVVKIDYTDYQVELRPAR
jgi:hypothetical protein